MTDFCVEWNLSQVEFNARGMLFLLIAQFSGAVSPKTGPNRNSRVNRGQ